jgi:hypothetical protein
MTVRPIPSPPHGAKRRRPMRPEQRKLARRRVLNAHTQVRSRTMALRRSAALIPPIPSSAGTLLRQRQSRGILVSVSAFTLRFLSTQPYGRAPVSTLALAAALAIATLACDPAYQQIPADGGLEPCDPPVPATCDATGKSALLPVAAARCPALAASFCGYPADTNRMIYLGCVSGSDSDKGAYGYIYCTDPGCGYGCPVPASDAEPLDVAVHDATTTD